MAIETTRLSVGGMTCAACAGRIERRLNRLDGVRAEVNLAAESAVVVHPPELTLAEIIATVRALGYSVAVDGPPAAAEPGDTISRIRLIVAAACAIPVLVVSMVPAWQFTYWQWLVAGLATPVVLGAGWPFHRRAFALARQGGAGMDTLVSLGALVAYLWSSGELIFGGAGRAGLTMSAALLPGAEEHSPAVVHLHYHGGPVLPPAAPVHLYFEVAAAIILFMLVGRWFEGRARHRGAAALRALAELSAREATVLADDGAERRMPADGLRPGDRFVVRPGEKVPTDGVVEAGAGAVDASLLTGESIPVEVATGSAVVGGTVNTGGRLIVRATQVGADTRLAQIGRLVRDAQNGKARVQRLADDVAGIFVPFLLIIAVATFAGWLADHPATEAVRAAVAVLVVACPCALGLATPTALLAGTGRGARLGLLIRGPQALESARRVDTVLLDKTGTLTSGLMRVADVVPGPGVTRAELLRRAAAVEQAAEHPVAHAIVIAAGAEGTAVPAVTGFTAHAGAGAAGTVDGERVVVGSARHLAAEGVTGPLPVSDGPWTVVHVGWAGRVRGTITVADRVRPTAPAAVARLRALGIRPVLLTGDTAAAARSVAAELDDVEVIAEVAPEQKLEIVRRLQAEGRRVAMVGDGVNDAAALAAADLGVALVSGTDAAIEAGDVTIVRVSRGAVDLMAVADAIGLARATLRTIKANLFWAFAYNMLAIPLAATGLVTPMVAAAAMACSSLLVVANSLRLFRWRPRSVDAASAPITAAVETGLHVASR